MSADGSRVYLESAGSYTSEDTDPPCDLEETGAPCIDVYENSATHGTRLVSTGPQSTPCCGSRFVGGSDSGDRVFFETAGSLVAGDMDSDLDIYERFPGTATTALVSGGPVSALFKGASADGTRVLYETAGAHRATDTDAPRVDVYKAEVASTAGHLRPAGATPLRIALVPAAQECTTPNRQHGPPLAFSSCAPPHLAHRT